MKSKKIKRERENELDNDSSSIKKHKSSTEVSNDENDNENYNYNYNDDDEDDDDDDYDENGDNGNNENIDDFESSKLTHRENCKLWSGKVSKINDFLYISGGVFCKKLKSLKKIGITHILNACYLPNFHPNDFVYLNIQIHDNKEEDILKHFPTALQFMESASKQKGSKLLIHCRYGISRSVSFGLLWLMFKSGINYKSAIVSIRKKRPLAKPNVGFASTLIKWGRNYCEAFNSPDPYSSTITTKPKKKSSSHVFGL